MKVKRRKMIQRKLAPQTGQTTSLRPTPLTKGRRAAKRVSPELIRCRDVQNGQPTGKGPTPLRRGQKGSREGRPRADAEQERQSGQATTLHFTPLRGGQRGSKEGKSGTEATPANLGEKKFNRGRDSTLNMY